jgi:hypothetical protein
MFGCFSPFSNFLSTITVYSNKIESEEFES